MSEITGPTYYVRHPDESYSVADPQPSLGDSAMASDIYDLMDSQWSDGWCNDVKKFIDDLTAIISKPEKTQIHETSTLDFVPDGKVARYQFRKDGGEWSEISHEAYSRLIGNWEYELRKIIVVEGDKL